MKSNGRCLIFSIPVVVSAFALTPILSFLMLATDGVTTTMFVDGFVSPFQLNRQKNSVLLSSSWKDSIQDLFSGATLKKSFRTTVSSPNNSTSNNNGAGVVIRLAGRAYNATSSTPASRDYTTRKKSFPEINVTKQGIQGDYNHYRTVALQSTPDRAVSILTSDVMASLRATYPSYSLQDGDLGENIYIDGISFHYFQVGKQYKFETKSKSSQAGDGKKKNNGGDSSSAVIVEITEPIEPCANLCKLRYINDESLSPGDRIKRCQDFIIHLDRYDGYRGWYAKVIQEGIIGLDAQIETLAD